MGHCGEQGAVTAIRGKGSSPWAWPVAVAESLPLEGGHFFGSSARLAKLCL